MSVVGVVARAVGDGLGRDLVAEALDGLDAIPGLTADARAEVTAELVRLDVPHHVSRLGVALVSASLASGDSDALEAYLLGGADYDARNAAILGAASQAAAAELHRQQTVDAAAGVLAGLARVTLGVLAFVAIRAAGYPLSIEDVLGD